MTYDLNSDEYKRGRRDAYHTTGPRFSPNSGIKPWEALRLESRDYRAGYEMGVVERRDDDQAEAAYPNKSSIPAPRWPW